MAEQHSTQSYLAVADPYACRLIALNGYAAWSNTLVGNQAPKIREQFERSNDPQPGDLVLETSTLFRWVSRDNLGPGVALGWLLRKEREPIMSREDFDKLHADGDYYNEPGESYESLPTEQIHYLRPLDNSEVEEQRWENANFIRVLTDLPDA